MFPTGLSEKSGIVLYNDRLPADFAARLAESFTALSDGDAAQAAALLEFGQQAVEFLALRDETPPHMLPQPALKGYQCSAGGFSEFGHGERRNTKRWFLLMKKLQAGVRGYVTSHGEVFLAFWRLSAAEMEQLCRLFGIDFDDPVNKHPPGVEVVVEVNFHSKFATPIGA